MNAEKMMTESVLFREALHSSFQHNCVTTLSELIDEYNTNVQPLCACFLVKHQALIYQTFQYLYINFNTFDENTRSAVCFSIQVLKKGIKTIKEADEECDTLKLAEGNDLVKSFLSWNAQH
jgi:hypothetical protein